MTKVLIIMMAGAFTGYLLRNSKRIIQINERLIMLAVFGLLFLMGVTIGSNSNIVERLPELGFTALSVAIAGIVGSVALGSLLYYFVFRHKT